MSRQQYKWNATCIHINNLTTKHNKKKNNNNNNKQTNKNIFGQANQKLKHPEICQPPDEQQGLARSLKEGVHFPRRCPLGLHVPFITFQSSF